MKTFSEFIKESDSKRQAFDNLPGDYASNPSKEPTLLDRIRAGVQQLIPNPKNYIRQDLERRNPNLSVPMPGAERPFGDPTDVKVKSNMPIIRGRYTLPKYYDV